MNLLRRNEGAHKTLCCCCESYQDVQDSLCCYNNVSKVKTYICKDCSVLKDQNDEAHLAFLKKQVTLEKAHRHAFGEASRSVVITASGAPTAANSVVGPDVKAKRCRTIHLNSAERIRHYDDMGQRPYKSAMGRTHTRGNMQAEPADYLFVKELVENQPPRGHFPHWGNPNHISKSGVAYNTSAACALKRVNTPLQYCSAQMGKNEHVHVSASNGTQHIRSACKSNLRGDHSDGRQLRQGVHVNIDMYAAGELLNGVKNHRDEHPPRGSCGDLRNAHSKLKGEKILNKFHIYDDMGSDIHQRSGILTDHAGVDSREENPPHRSYHNGDVPCKCHPLSNKCTHLLYSYNGTNSNNCRRIKIDHIFNANL
ncbi:hypothetical protein PVMG_01970 [Plasmodium vivax Mauritania I]|uniref:Uncharacterized protein n=1 Tax=Plasmodium vivax Mauritania I TaxID=1035515 RepID=A0A0J9THC5_PLAVI|nr:hypothetical protein PVMG_01970 [Plasmodium vivax Mauritania I]